MFVRNTLIASSSGSSPMSADSSSPCNIHKLRLETCDKSDEKKLVEDLPLAPLPSFSLIVELVLHVELVRLSHFLGNAIGKVQQSVTKVSVSRLLTRSNRVRWCFMSSSQSGDVQFQEKKVKSQYDAGPWMCMLFLEIFNLDTKLPPVLYWPRLPLIVLTERQYVALSWIGDPSVPAKALPQIQFINQGRLLPEYFYNIISIPITSMSTKPLKPAPACHMQANSAHLPQNSGSIFFLLWSQLFSKVGMYFLKWNKHNIPGILRGNFKYYFADFVRKGGTP